MDEPKIYIPEILTPREDGVFKRLLTHPDAQPVIRMAASGILNTTVEFANVVSNELPIDNDGEKQERFDVNCITDSGDHVAIEMQADEMKGDNSGNNYINTLIRSFYGVSDAFSSQYGKGLAYGRFHRAYHASFLGYNIFHDDPDRFVNRCLYHRENGKPLPDMTCITFIELPKLKDVLKKEASKMNRLEVFSSFLAIADKPQYAEKLDDLKRRWEEISVAYELLTSISKNEQERIAYHSRRMAELKRNTEFENVRAEGIEIGRSEGKLEGRLEGKLEGKLEGRLEGRLEGKLEGRLEGILEGKLDGRLEAAIDAIQKLGITVPASIALLSGVSEERANELIKQYSQK